MTSRSTPRVERLTVYPVKSLDGLSREQAEITTGGNLRLDREYAVVDRPAREPYDPDAASPHRDYINGKRTAMVHRLRSSFDPESHTVTVRTKEDLNEETFSLDATEELNRWLSEYFGRPVSLRREPIGGHPDHRKSGISGPSVISTATLQEVASWFDDLDIENVRRRFRANIEISGVPAFWEDRLYADHGEAVAFRIGNVQFQGVEPCERCVVPTRDPDTGEKDGDFRERFIRKRRETRPEWLDSNRFDHDFRLMVITDVPESEIGETIETGDRAEIVGTIPISRANPRHT
jgi:uncharacterized protein YcbX